MNLGNVASVMQMAYQYQNRTQKTSVNGNSFTNSLQEASGANVSKMDAYTEQLRAKYGNVMITNVGKDQNSMDNLGMGTAGTSNVVIAPNILEQMANEPEKAAYYEEKIQYYFDSLPRYAAELSAMGHEIHSSGIVVHPDGTVTHYISGDLKPEEKAKIDAQIKAEQEEKAKRKKQYQERSQEVAEERAKLEKIQYQKQLTEQIQNGQKYDGTINFHIVGPTQFVAPAVSAYEKAISTMSSSMIQGI